MYWEERGRRIGYWWSVVTLLGHLLGTAVIFTGLFTLGWLVSVALHALHRYHPFPDEMFRFVTRLELYLLYVDAFVSGTVLMAGTVKFCKRLIEVER